MLFAFPHLRNPGEAATCHYLKAMAERVRKNSSVLRVLVFGSVARQVWYDRSDIDLRLVRKPGLLNAVAANCVTLRERFLAFAAGQPIDMYLADDVKFLKKMREDEPPIFLIKRGGYLDRMYPEQEETILERLG